jgi:hypothetical protein
MLMWFLYFEEHRSAAIFATAMAMHFGQVAKIATPWPTRTDIG